MGDRRTTDADSHLGALSKTGVAFENRRFRKPGTHLGQTPVFLYPLYGLHLAVKVGAKAFDLLFRKKKRKEMISPIAEIARTPMGRFAIAEGLHTFYHFDDWMGRGRGEFTGQSLGSVFERERFKFTVRSHHSYPACKKK